jgi:hypothetical protein
MSSNPFSRYIEGQKVQRRRRVIAALVLIIVAVVAISYIV